MQADAVIHPYAVVIVAYDACLAEGAVLTSRWLLETARAAIVGWMIERVVEGVAKELRFGLGWRGDV